MPEEVRGRDNAKTPPASGGAFCKGPEPLTWRETQLIIGTLCLAPLLINSCLQKYPPTEPDRGRRYMPKVMTLSYTIASGWALAAGVSLFRFHSGVKWPVQRRLGDMAENRVSFSADGRWPYPQAFNTWAQTL